MKIIFQGDSITDAGRDRSDAHLLGEGYPKYAAIELKKMLPEADIEFLNYGVSGDRSGELLSRIEKEGIEQKPDIISILIGINDVWHRHTDYGGTTDEKFRENFVSTLKKLREKTDAKIVILYPFLLDCDDKEDVRAYLINLLPIVKEIAGEYADVCIPLDAIFEEAMKTQPKKLWFSDDGVHPNENGSKFIGRVYAEQISALFG